MSPEFPILNFSLNKILAAEPDNFVTVKIKIAYPVMDGYKAASTIRALSDPIKVNIPILALTASSSGDIFPKVIAAGMQDCLSKPYETGVIY